MNPTLLDPVINEIHEIRHRLSASFTACIQWINLNHHDIECTTLLGSGRTMGAGR